MHFHDDLINELGGTKALADLCRVSAPSVSQWRTDGIPQARLMFLELARPDIDWRRWRDVAGSEGLPVEVAQ